MTSTLDIERYSRYLPSVAFGVPEIAKEAAGHEFHGNQYSGGGDSEHPVPGSDIHAGDTVNYLHLAPGENGQFRGEGTIAHDHLTTPVDHPVLGRLWSQQQVDRAHDYDKLRAQGLTHTEANSVLNSGYVLPGVKTHEADLVKEDTGHEFHGNQWNGGGDAHHDLAGALRSRADQLEEKAVRTNGSKSDVLTGHAHGLREAAQVIEQHAGDHAAVHGALQQRVDESKPHPAGSDYSKGTYKGYAEALKGLGALAKEMAGIGHSIAHEALGPVLSTGGQS